MSIPLGDILFSGVEQKGQSSQSTSISSIAGVPFAEFTIAEASFAETVQHDATFGASELRELRKFRISIRRLLSVLDCVLVRHGVVDDDDELDGSSPTATRSRTQ